MMAPTNPDTASFLFVMEWVNFCTTENKISCIINPMPGQLTSLIKIRYTILSERFNTSCSQFVTHHPGALLFVVSQLTLSVPVTFHPRWEAHSCSFTLVPVVRSGYGNYNCMLIIICESNSWSSREENTTRRKLEFYRLIFIHTTNQQGYV